MTGKVAPGGYAGNVLLNNSAVDTKTMPFQPGVSGNPRGRPRKADSLAELVRAATNDGADPVEFLVRVMAGKVRGCTVSHRLQAATELLDRGYGKAANYIEADVQETVSVVDPRQVLQDRINAIVARNGQDGGTIGPS